MGSFLWFLGPETDPWEAFKLKRPRRGRRRVDAARTCCGQGEEEEEEEEEFRWNFAGTHAVAAKSSERARGRPAQHGLPPDETLLTLEGRLGRPRVGGKQTLLNSLQISNAFL